MASFKPSQHSARQNPTHTSHGGVLTERAPTPVSEVGRKVMADMAAKGITLRPSYAPKEEAPLELTPEEQAAADALLLEEEGMGTGTMLLIGLGGVAVIGGGIYWYTRGSPPKVSSSRVTHTPPHEQAWTPEEARQNPSTTTVLAVAGIGGGVWIYTRLQARKKLQKMLEESDVITAAIASGAVTWTPESKAAEKITFTNAKSADRAFAEILAEVMPLLPADELDAMLDQAKQVFEQSTGLDVDPYVKEGTVGGRVLETTRKMWSWISGEEGEPVAKTNPEQNWEQFLRELQ